MEFWGVEVKAGEPVKAEPADDCIIHLSHVALGEVKKDKPNESVILFANIGDQKLVLGTLSTHNNQQISFDLVFDREVELSHNWKNGSVYFLGYEVETPGETDSSDDSDEEQPMELATESGVQSLEEKKGPASAVLSNTAKPESAKQKSKSVQIKDVKADESDDDDSDSDSDDEGDSSDDGSDEEGMSVEEDSDDDEEDDTESEEETPKKAEKDNKRPKDSATKTPVPSKKQKQETPQKTGDGKKSVHTATPHPAKAAAKTSANGTNTKAQTPKSAGKFTCSSCDRSFGSDVALQSHSKAKHGAK